jgi:hypothetical protein
MVAIVTKFIAPTNTRGARIKASAGKGRDITVPYWCTAGGDYAAHAIAAYLLMRKMNWQYDLICGGTDTGRVFVMAKCGTLPEFNVDVYTYESLWVLV